MKKTILKYGVISGLLSAAMMVSTVPFMHQLGSASGWIIGYTAITLSFLLVFFGVKSYRQNHDGKISFGKAFAVGILITLISCAFYVLTWEILYFNFMPGFGEKLVSYMLHQKELSGASQQAMAVATEEMKQFLVKYNTVPYNAAMTFMEPFPVGLIVTLVTAIILRRK